MSWLFHADSDGALKKVAPNAAESAAWETLIGKLAGLRGPLREQDITPAMAALEAVNGPNGHLQPEQAAALTSWLGGMVHAQGHGLLAAFNQAFLADTVDGYLDVASLVDTNNDVTVNIGDALGRLRQVNAAAHAWVVDRARAKAEKRAYDDDKNLQADMARQVERIARNGEQIYDAAKESIVSTFDLVTWILRHPWWTLAGVALVLVLLLALAMAVRPKLSIG